MFRDFIGVIGFRHKRPLIFREDSSEGTNLVLSGR